MKNLSLPAQIYVLGVILIGGVLAVVLPQLPGATSNLTTVPFAIFLAAALLTQLRGVRVIMPGREGMAWSLINAIIVASLLLFPLGNTVVLILLTFGAYWIKRRELPWYQGAFNVAQHVLSVAVAAAVWTLGRPSSAAGLLTLDNGTLVTTAITLAAGKPVKQVGVISRASFYREMILVWLGAVVADFWAVNPWRTVLLTLPLVGLSQMLRLQLEDADRVRRSQQEAEGRTQQLVSLNELARALTSSLDIEQIYDALHAKVRKVVDLQVFAVGLPDAPANTVVFGTWRVGDRALPSSTRSANEPTLARLLGSREPVVLEAGRDRETIRELAPAGGWADVPHMVVVPMALGERAVGLIVLGLASAPSVQQLDLVSTMASQAAVAVEKAQLFGRERRKSAQLGAITQVSKKIVTIHSVDVLLQQTSRLIEEAFDFERVQVLLQEGDTRSAPPPDPTATDIPILYRGLPIGVLRVWLRPGASFSSDDLSMLQTLADEIAVAIENARLYENLQEQMAMLEQAQFQLMHSAKLATIGELAAFIAHEINNPLTSVLGYASLILSETPADDPKRSDLEVIEKESLRARAIVRDLLGYARQTDSAMEQTGINDALESILPLIRKRAESQRSRATAPGRKWKFRFRTRGWGSPPIRSAASLTPSSRPKKTAKERDSASRSASASSSGTAGRLPYPAHRGREPGSRSASPSRKHERAGAVRPQASGRRRPYPGRRR